MKKKTMLLAVCLILAGLLAVNGTFASEFGKWFQTVVGLLDPAPEENAEAFRVSLNTPTGEQMQLNPGSTIDYAVTASNLSEEATAYFRVAVALQTAAFDHITIERNEDDYIWTDGWSDIKIGTDDYKLIVGTYPQELRAGPPPSPAAIERVSMASVLTNEQLAAIRPDFLKMKVLAIKKEDFVVDGKQLEAEDALDMALPIVPNFNPF